MRHGGGMRILRIIHSGKGGRVFQPVHRSLRADAPAFRSNPKVEARPFRSACWFNGGLENLPSVAPATPVLSNEEAGSLFYASGGLQRRRGILPRPSNATIQPQASTKRGPRCGMSILLMIHSGNGGRVFQPVHRSPRADTPAPEVWPLTR